MADNEFIKQQVDIVLTGDASALKKTLEGLNSVITTTIATSVINGIEAFGKQLQNQIKLKFDANVLKELKEPIRIEINTVAAQAKIDKLVSSLEPLKSALNSVDKITKPKKETPTKTSNSTTSSTGIAKDFTDVSQSNLKRSITLARKGLDDLGDPGKEIENQLDELYAKVSKLKRLKDEGKNSQYFSDKDLETLRKYNIELEKQEVKATRLKAIKTNPDQFGIDKLKDSLAEARATLFSFGLTEKQVDSLTTKAAASLEKLRDQYNLLIDSVKKGDLTEASKALISLDKARPLTESKIKAVNDTDTDLIIKEIDKRKDAEIKAGIVVADAAKKQRIEFNNRVNKEDAEVASKAKAIRDKLAEDQSTIGGLKGGNVNISKLDDLEEKLKKQRKAVSNLDVPVATVNKQTRNYDTTLVNLRNSLIDLEKEYKYGNISIDKAIPKYKQLNDQIRKLEIGIDNIDAKKLKDAFDIEKNDPGELSFRLLSFGYALGNVAGALSNFARNSFQAFSQLAQFSEPIERLTNNLDLQVKEGTLSLEDRATVLLRLREIGDLPGSSVEEANKSYNLLQKINLTLQQRLDLTEGIAKIAAAPGGSDESATRFSDALQKIATQGASGGQIDQEQLKTLRASGGLVVTKFLEDNNIATTKNLEKFGVKKFVIAISKELQKIEVPELTTTDRINKLRSRVSEIGVLIGKVLAPGLGILNEVLDKLSLLLKEITARFDALPKGIKTAISGILIAIPVLAGLAGAILSVVSALTFAFFAFTKAKEILPVAITGLKDSITKIAAFTKAPIIAKAAVATTASTAVLAGPSLTGAPLVRQLAGPSLVTSALKGAPLAGLETLVGAKNITGLAKISASLGGISSFLGKIFGLSGPIGIAFNLLLSVFGAFSSNFNGVRDRLVFVFRELDIQINNLLIALGFTPDGLLGILKAVFNFVTGALGGAFNTVGSLILDILITIIQTIGKVVEQTNNFIKAIKGGDFIGAISAIGNVTYDLFAGLFVNLGLALTATIVDAVASALESIGGGAGILSRGLRETANDIRRLNGTDATTVAAAADRQKRLDDVLDTEKKIADTKKKGEEEAIAAESQRLELVKNLNLDLLEFIEKSKDERFKFTSEQQKQQLEGKSQEIGARQKETTELGQRSLSRTSTLAGANNIAESLIQQNNLLSQQQISLKQQEGNISSLQVIKESFSPSSEFYKLIKRIVISDPFSNIAESFKPVLESLENIQKETSGSKVDTIIPILEKQFKTAIDNNTIKFPASTGIKDIIPKQLDGLDIALSSSTDKAKVELEKSRKEQKKLDIERVQTNNKIVTDLKNQEAKIKTDDLNRQNKILEITKEKDILVRDITNEAKTEAAIREGIYSTSKKDNEEQNQIRIKRREALEKEVNDISLEKTRQLLLLDAEIDSIKGRQGGDPEQEEKLINELQRGRQKIIREADSDIRLLRNNASEIENAFTKLYGEKALTRLRVTFSAISNELREINTLSFEAFNKFGKSLARFSSNFGSGGVGVVSQENNTTFSNPSDLRAEVDRLAEREGLSKLSIEYIKLNDLIDRVENSSYNATDAMKEFVKISAEIGAQSEIKEFNDQLIKTNLLIKGATGSDASFFDPTSPFDENKVQKGTPINKDGLTLLLSTLTNDKQATLSDFGTIFDNNELSDENKALIKEEILKAVNNQTTIDPQIISDIVQNTSSTFTEVLTQLQTSGVELPLKDIYSSFIDILIRTSNESEDAAKKLLASLFKIERDDTRVDNFLEFIKLLKLSEKKNNALIDQTLKAQIKIAEDGKTVALDTNSKGELQATSDLTDVEIKLKSSQGREKKRLLAQQTKIKLQLINFNYEKSEIEAAYQTQKEILEAKGNLAEITRIEEQGKKVRKQLKDDRDKAVTDLILSQGGSFKNNKLVDASGNPVEFKGSVDVPDVGDKEGSSTITGGTKPKGTVTDPTRAEQTLATIALYNKSLEVSENSARAAGDAALEMFDKVASGSVAFDKFKDLIFDTKFSLENLGEAFTSLAAFGLTAFANALGKAVTDVLVNGGSFLKSLGKFFGDMLIQLGTMLLQLAIVSLAIAALSLIPFLRPILGDPALSVVGAAIAGAAGIGLILAGKALGGGGGGGAKEPAKVSNTGASNSANSTAGNSGTETYDPAKDPKLVYQKALRTEIFIDIKRDDGSIVKAVINGVNRDPRFANLIGNGRTGQNFAL